MCEIDIESVRLTRKLGLCSNALARAMTRFKDIESMKYENDVIVFVTNNPEQIKEAFQKSLKNNGMYLDYIFTTAKSFYLTNTKAQVFITTSDPLEADSLSVQFPKSIVVDIVSQMNSQRINHYMELMVKNIHTHVKFTIKKQTEQGGL
jgi:ribonucleotide monophosphatase NagD (HAD superfamily)